MKSRRRLSTKFFSIGLGLLILALLSIGSTMWVTRQLDGGAAAVNEAGRLRMQSWRLTSLVQDRASAALIAQRLEEMAATLDLLQHGDQQRPLGVPWNASTEQKFAALQAEWTNLRDLWVDPAAHGDASLLPRVAQFVQSVDALVGAIESTLAKLTAMLNLFQFMMMALALAAAIVMMYIGYLFVIQPLQRLQSGLRRVEQGNFDTRVQVDSTDEFGDLAAGFNHMALTLQGLYHGLERKVEEKTQDLEAERQRLSSLYEVSNFLVEANSLDEIAQGFSRLMRRISGADAVAIRWTDEANEHYLMLANDQLADEITDSERCIEAGQCACGQTMHSARTRVIPITPVDAQLVPTMCARAGYASLVSVPIRVQQRLLGEVDLFYRQTAVLNREDRDLYDALVGHLANAIEKLRADALEREAAASEERTLLARELHDSIAQSLSFLRIQITFLRQAMREHPDERLARIVEDLEAGVTESTNDVRELLVHFRTRTNSDDIEDALRTTLQKFEHQSGVKGQFEIKGHGVALPSDVQLQVLHVVQEALSNVRKHAQADRVQLSVERGDVWRFWVRDNGCGFLPQPARADDTHVGTHIMRERAQRIHAKLAVRSAPGEGTEVLIEVSP